MPGKGKGGVWPRKEKPPLKEKPPDTPAGVPTRKGGLKGNVQPDTGNRSIDGPKTRT